MEQYRLKNGKVYSILRWTDTCTVALKEKIVYTGAYGDCRRYIDSMKKGGAR